MLLILKFDRGVSFVSRNISGIKQNYFASYDKSKVGDLVRIADFVLNLGRLRSGLLLSRARYPHRSLQSYDFFRSFARGNPYKCVGKSLQVRREIPIRIGKSLFSKFAWAPTKWVVAAMAGWGRKKFGVGISQARTRHSRGLRPAGRTCKPEADSRVPAHDARAGRPA